MSSMRSFASLTLIAAALTGCANTQSAPTASILPASTSVAAAAEPGGYVMTADELDYDCKQLTGRMQVRILEVRDFNERAQSSGASRLLQSAITGIIGGTSAGKDPVGTTAKDRAMLQAYNNQLKAKGCKSYNLDDELRPKDVKVTPVPTIDAPKKPAP
jgi:TolA-binding protein